MSGPSGKWTLHCPHHLSYQEENPWDMVTYMFPFLGKGVEVTWPGHSPFSRQATPLHTRRHTITFAIEIASPLLMQLLLLLQPLPQTSNIHEESISSII